MSKGRRYEEPKLNMKKVFAVIVAFVVIVMCVIMLKGILDKDKTQGKITSKDYFAAYQNNKWGVIDSTGNIVINPSYAEMIIVPNSKNDVFLCIYDVDYDKGTYKTKALNSSNQEIFTDYSQVEAISNKDSNGNLYYENALKVQKDGKYGIIDLSGKEILACEYDNIEALEGLTDILKTSKDGKYGVATIKGSVMVPTEYSEIKALGKEANQGFIVKNSNGKYGIVDTINKTVLETKYDDIVEKTKDYFHALKLAPQKVTNFFKGLFDKEKQDELEKQKLVQEKIQAERKAREEAKEKSRLEKQKLKNSPEYKKRRADRDAR